MPPVNYTKVPYGGRRARSLCNLPHSSRLDLIAEGLPVILTSARGFWRAAEQLTDHPREATVLEGLAEEEAAKALILVDLVRCPPKRVNERVGRIVSELFYNHLARMIYSTAQSWKPVNIMQLQEYVDHERKAHFVDGYAGQHILPNWTIYSRESAMYADIEEHEEGGPRWNDPQHFASPMNPTRPISLELVEALSALGVFTRAGLEAMSEIWGTVDFLDTQDPSMNRELTLALGERLEGEKLVTERATDLHGRCFHGHWQMPMYNLRFSLLPVPLEVLDAERKSALWTEIGY